MCSNTAIWSKIWVHLGKKLVTEQLEQKVILDLNIEDSGNNM